MSQINALTLAANHATFMAENLQYGESKKSLVKLCSEILRHPELIKEITPDTLKAFSQSFALMLDLRISNDDDVNSSIAAISYFLSSKHIKQAKNANSNINNAVRDRILSSHWGHDYLIIVAIKAFDIFDIDMAAFGMTRFQLQAAGELYKMEIADLEENSAIYKNIETINEWRNEHLKRIKDNYFHSLNNINEIVKKGKINHDKLYEYLESKIEVYHDLEF